MNLKPISSIKFKKNNEIAYTMYGEYVIEDVWNVWVKWRDQDPEFMADLIAKAKEWEKGPGLRFREDSPCKGILWSVFFEKYLPSPENNERMSRRIPKGEVLNKLENQIEQHYVFFANRYQGQNKAYLYGSHNRALEKILEILGIIEIHEDEFQDSCHELIKEVAVIVFNEECEKDNTHTQLLSLQDSVTNSMSTGEHNKTVSSSSVIEDKELQEALKHPYAHLQAARMDFFKRLGYQQNTIEMFVDHPGIGELLKTMVSCTELALGNKNTLYPGVMYPLLTDAFTHTSEGVPRKEPAASVLAAVLRVAIRYHMIGEKPVNEISNAMRTFTSLRMVDLNKAEQLSVKDAIRMMTGESPKGALGKSAKKSDTPAAVAGKLVMDAFVKYLDRTLY